MSKTTPALLTIHLESETINGNVNLPYDGIIDIHARIPKQTIILKSIQVLTDSTAPSLCYVDLPFLGAHNLLDGLSYMSRLPIVLNQNGFSTIRDVNIPLIIHNPIEPRFRMRVYKRDGSLFSTGLVSITLQFSLEVSSITV